MNDQELIIACKSDYSLFSQIELKYKRMIYSIITKFYIYPSEFRIDKDDLYQEALLALWQAVKEYDYKRNASFTTYAYLIVYRALLKIVKSHNKNNYYSYRSIDSMELSDYSEKLKYEDEYRDYSEIEKEYKKILSKLKTKDQSLIKLYNDGYSYKEIADFLDLSIKKIDNRLFYLKTKLRKDLEYYFS